MRRRRSPNGAVADPHDEETDRLAGMPYTIQGYAALAMAAGRVHDALHRTPYKAIVVDADNTLWGGICGEVGAADVVVDGGWAAFQHFLLAKRAEGFLLCLCSRNNLADVEEVFATRVMPLSLDSFAAVRIGWADKARYVIEIATDLGLGLDSLVFIDDDAANVLAVERDTGVTALQCPGRPGLLTDFSARLWPLDKVRVSDADRQRADGYRIEHDRRRAVASGGDRRSIVEALGVAIDFASLEEADLARAADLIQRTNQFNLTLRRRSLAALRADLDSGLEGTVVRGARPVRQLWPRGGNALSARGRKRAGGGYVPAQLPGAGAGVLEQAMARRLATSAGAHATIVFDAVEGPRNRPALDFFAALPGDSAQRRSIDAQSLATFTLRSPDVSPSGLGEMRAAPRAAAASGVYAELATVIRRADQVPGVGVGDRCPHAPARTLRSATYRDGDGRRGFLLGTVRARRDRSRRQLLRPGRQFAPGRAACRAHPPHVRGAGVQLRVVFENPTVAALAEAILLMAGHDTAGEDEDVMEF